MANSLRISYKNGVYQVERDLITIGQGRTIETALENAVNSEPPPGALFQAAEVLMNIMGPVSESHGQVATREP